VAGGTIGLCRKNRNSLAETRAATENYSPGGVAERPKAPLLQKRRRRKSANALTSFTALY
jgi:hypothetical protein